MARCHGILKPGRGKIDDCLRNHSAKQITLPKQTIVGEIATANVIPSLLALKPTQHKEDRMKLPLRERKDESQKQLLAKSDLTGIVNWESG